MIRRRSSLAASPVLIGAATALVAIVAVVLAYNANTGLPFVRTYDVKITLRDAQRLTTGADARLGGARVGQVVAIRPREDRSGRAVAEVTLRLDQVIAPLPADSTVLVRSRSALGAKFVEITKGTGTRTLPAGGTLPVEQAVEEPVDPDQISAIYDARTRRAFRGGVREFGNAFAGRGQDVNDLLETLPETFERLAPVTQNLADPRTGLGDTIGASAQLAGEVAPVAETQAPFLAQLDTTFTALAGVARPGFQDVLESGVRVQRRLAVDLPVVKPFVRRTGRLMDRLEPAVAAVGDASPSVAAALQRGAELNPRLPELARRLDGASRSIRRLAGDPLVLPAIGAAGRTVDRASVLLTALTPTQVRCHYVSLFFRNASSVISEGNRWGTWQRSGTIDASSVTEPRGTPAPNLHYNALPNTGQPGSGGECEAGNEGFLPGTRIGNVPGVQRTDSLPMIQGVR